MNPSALNPSSRPGPEQHLRDLEILTQVSNQINRSLNLDQVMETSLTGLQSALGASFGCLMLFHPDANTLTLERANGLDAPLLKRLEKIVLDFQLAQVPSQDRLWMTMGLGQQIQSALQDSYENSLLIPLLTKSEVIGVLWFGIQHGQVLAPKNLDFLLTIGEQVAFAIENARLHTALQQSEARYREFVENSLECFWEGDRFGNILYVNQAACNLIGLEREAILQQRVDDIFVYDKSAGEQVSERLRTQGTSSSPRGRIRIANGEIKIVSITTTSTLDSDGNVLRYQTLFHDVTEQTQSIDALAQRNQELAALNSIAEILAHPLEMEHALELVCQEIISITGMESAVVYLKDNTGQYLKLLAHRGVSASLLSQVQVLGLDDPATHMVIVEGKAIALNELSDFVSPQSFLGPREEGYHAGVCAPIERRGAPVGAILVGSKSKNQYTQSDVDLMLNVGRQIGTALENADLFARMQRRVSELEGLAQLGIACNETLDPLALSQIAVDWGHKLLQTDYVILRRFENNRMHLSSFIAPDGVELREEMEVDPVFGPIVQESISLVIPNIEKSNLPEFHRQNFLSTGMQSIVVTPMAARDHVIGAMAIAYQQPHAWQAHELDLLRTIAHQLASAIDSAQLFQKVLSEQRKIQAIFDSGLSGLYVTDAAGRIVMFNDAAKRITGWSLAELRDRTWNEMFRDPAQDDTIQSLIDQALSQKKTIFAQEGRKIRRRDGRIIPVAKAVAPLLDEQGNVTGAVGAFWDLSREEQVEFEREEFLRLVAHQLRSPLTGLLSALELLEKPDLSKKRRALMWNIVKSDGERLRRFASQFLKMESVVQAERRIDLTPISINDLVKELVKKYKTDRTHPFTVCLPKPGVSALANQDGLEHVLHNLIDNAILYTPNGTSITISVSAVEPDQVLIQVEDKGPGISAVEQTKIFQPFYRSPRELSTHTYGHGLGLAIAQRLVKEMDGELAVTSQEGAGATFYFTLRRHA